MGGNRGPAEGRAYDVLYDPLYTVSGARDHYRQQAQSAGYTLEKVPNFPNFFSEVPTFPAQSLRLKAANDVPPFVPRDFRPDQPAPHELQGRSTSGNVSGANLVKFLHQPLLSKDDVAENRALSTVKFATPARSPSPKSRAASRAAGLAAGPHSVTVGTQSDYRESEAQTVPYTPDYVIPEGAPEPEILALRELTYGSGLPAGAAAVALVDKMRLKREFEATLPPLSGTEQELAVRKRMMEAWERQEWADREAGIAQAQEDRLASMVAAIEQREAAREQEIRRKMEGLKATKDAERSKALAGIQKKRIQTMRKLTQARTQGEKSLTKRDIIEEYADYGSRVYAPITRAGAALTGKGLEINSAVVEPASLPGVAHLERSLSRKTLPRVTSPNASTKKLSLVDAREQSTTRAQLKHIDNLLQTSKTMSNGTRGMGDAWPCPLDANEEAARLAKTRARAPSLRLRKKPTGRVAPPVENEEQRARRKRRRAIIFLQSLIRGRAAQAAMFETRARLQTLVTELQAAAQPVGDPSPVTSEAGLPTGIVVPGPSVTLEAIKDEMLGAVLGDMMSVLTVEDVAQRRAKLREIEAAHVENQARILREEQEARERMLRGPELPPDETPLDEEKEHLADGGAGSKKHGHHKHGSGGHKHREHGHKHRKHGHKHGEASHKREEDGSREGEEAHGHGHKDGGHRHKRGEDMHKHGEHGHKHRENGHKLQANEGEDTHTNSDLGEGGPTQGDGIGRTSDVRRTSGATLGNDSFRSEGGDGSHREDADDMLASPEKGRDGGEMVPQRGRMHGAKSKFKKKVKADGRKGDGRSAGSVRQDRKSSFVKWADTGYSEVGRGAADEGKAATDMGGEAKPTEEEGGRTAERNETRAEGEAAFEQQESDEYGEESGSGSDTGSETEGTESEGESSAGSYSDEEESAGAGYGTEDTADAGNGSADGAADHEAGHAPAKARAKRPPHGTPRRPAWADVDPEVGAAAATRIQAHLRGHQDRQLVARMRLGST
ncbi:hypothetical protein KFL_002610160 [Klebsormidium nitens]|uniref:Cilia- and flagella-associated protein 91 n=1 Tax=Klebsormidium nitens TaxID=105231 RepID=A0A1Y1I4R3_KLENI|nr:hypothetical protein KFL_002610160 [Klebsormidium nitens]|eukprot:GAQ85930.1 hypothetical protein KFL_002610160 [Klebsormidium nitens]